MNSGNKKKIGTEMSHSILTAEHFIKYALKELHEILMLYQEQDRIQNDCTYTENNMKVWLRPTRRR